MRSIFAFFGLVAILLLCSDSSAQFPPQGGGQGGAGGFGGGKKNKGTGADGGFGGFGKGNKGGGLPGQGGFGGGQGGFGGGQGGFPGGGQGGFGGGQGGFPGGGQGGFGQGGFGGGKGKKNNLDPNQVFDSLARTRAFFLISEAPNNLQMPLRAFAKDKQLTSEQITRDQFLFFYPNQSEYRALAGAVMRNQGGGGMGGQGMQNGGGRGGPEAIAAWAEADFRKRDANQDDMLNFDEMPEALRDEMQAGRWDSNRDGLISLDEYKAYTLSRAQQMNDGNNNMNSNGGPLTILIEEDYDRRPDVIRAGKLPTNLPKWFTEMDTDQDGQIQLHEWYAYGNDPEKFKEWDRDDDKLLTAQEVLFKMKVQPIFLATNGNRGPGGGFNNANGDYAGPGDNGFGGNGGPGGGKKGKGNNGGGFGGDFGGGDNGFGNNGFGNGFGGGNGGPGGGKKGKGNNGGGGFGGFNGAGGGGGDMQDLILQFRGAGAKGKGFGGGDTGGDTGFGGGKGKGKGKKGGGG